MVENQIDVLFNLFCNVRIYCWLVIINFSRRVINWITSIVDVNRFKIVLQPGLRFEMAHIGTKCAVIFADLFFNNEHSAPLSDITSNLARHLSNDDN